MTRRASRWTAACSLVLASCLGGITGTAGPSAQGWRAAALTSFDDAWQTIHDSFYDPGFGGLDWAAARAELRPRVEAATSLEEARAVIRELLARLKRSHFTLLSASAADALPGPAAVPIDVRVVADEVVITRVADTEAARAGLTAGQTVLAVDGQPVGRLVNDEEAVDASTRHREHWRRVNRALHGADGSRVSLQVRGADGRERQVAVIRTLGRGEVVTLGNLVLRVAFESREARTPAGRRAGVIAFSVWMASVNEPIAAAVDRFRQHDGIVIDLRGNPGGLAAMMSGVAGHFITEPVVLGTMRTRQAPLAFKVNPRLVTADGRAVDVFGGPVAILVDELTGSTSETFAGAMQSLGRARVFGRQTMGQALPAVTKRLATGDVLMYAIGDFTTGDGRSLEGVGVVPNEPVPLSIRALSEGRDDVLEAALRWFDAGKSRP